MPPRIFPWKAVVAAISCIAVLSAAPARADVTVVATTPDIKSITEAVSGGTVRVESLIPPGADPEAFEPRPNHLAVLRRAALVIRVGIGYEHWLDRMLRQVGNLRLLPGSKGYLDLSAQIALLEVRGRSITTTPGHAHGHANPHYWLDPVNGEAMSGEIAAALIRLLPEQRDRIEAAHATFVGELKVRTERWTQALTPYRGVRLVSYHNSWPYFARRFRLNIVDVIEQKEGVSPSVARLAGLAAKIRAETVRAILHEPFQPMDGSRILGERTGVPVVLLAPSVGSVPQAQDYFALFDYNVDVLAKALAASQP